MLAHSLRRGLAAGVVAGVIAGVFAFLSGEPALREAIRLEELAASPVDDPTAGPQPPLVDRSTQQAMLPVATGVVGAALGGLFGLAWAFARPRIRDRSDWRASLSLGAAAWGAVVLFPALVYPAAPPGVGDPRTIDGRSGWFGAAVAGAIVAVVALWWLANRLADRGVPQAYRHTAVMVAGVVIAGVLATVLPSAAGGTGVPAELLWRFRLAALGTQTVLWAGIAVGFGLLTDRAVRSAPTVPATGTGVRS